MTPRQLAALRPRVWHLAELPARASIQRHGLLTAAALLDLHDVGPDGRRDIRERRRRESVPIGDGSAVLRDQTPLLDSSLERSLVDMSVEQWRTSLDARVFFWVRRPDADAHRAARLLSSRPQLLYELDTAALLARCGDAVEVSAINSGNTRRRPARRGSSTLRRLADSDLTPGRVKELTVVGGVPDLDGLGVRVTEV